MTSAAGNDKKAHIRGGRQKKGIDIRGIIDYSDKTDEKTGDCKC